MENAPRLPDEETLGTFTLPDDAAELIAQSPRPSAVHDLMIEYLAAVKEADPDRITIGIGHPAWKVIDVIDGGQLPAISQVFTKKGLIKVANRMAPGTGPDHYEGLVLTERGEWSLQLSRDSSLDEIIRCTADVRANMTGRRTLPSIPVGQAPPDVRERQQTANRRSKLSPRVRYSVMFRDDFTCQYCGRRQPEVVLEIDHRLPVSKGGDDSMDNLLTACDECNRGKGNAFIT